MKMTDPWIIRTLGKIKSTLEGISLDFGLHVFDYNNPHHVTLSQVGFGIIPNTDYETGDIISLGGTHETDLFLQCIVAGNSGNDIPDINTFDYYNSLNVIVIGTATFKRKYKSSLAVGHVISPDMKWYKVGEITSPIGVFNLTIAYSSLSVIRLLVKTTLILSQAGNKIILDGKSKVGEYMICPEAALLTGDGGLTEIWVKNKNSNAYAFSCSTVTYGNGYDISLYNTFAGNNDLPDKPIMALVDLEHVTKDALPIPFVNAKPVIVPSYQENYMPSFGAFPHIDIWTFSGSDLLERKDLRAKLIMVNGKPDSIKIDTPLPETGFLILR